MAWCCPKNHVTDPEKAGYYNLVIVSTHALILAQGEIEFNTFHFFTKSSLMPSEGCIDGLVS